MIKVAVFGAGGRMGGEVCRAVEADPDLDLVARIDAGDDREPAAAADVVVDFTHPGAVLDNLQWCLDRGLHVVVGTSGFTAERLERVRAMLGSDPRCGVLIAANFSIGAVLMMSFARQAAAHMTSAEIVELHHPNKADAPSGTAIATARGMAEARQAAELGEMPDATTDELDGARGASVDGVRVHSVRLAGLVAHQEVLFGSLGETLTIRHDSLDRVSFMPGVVLAVKSVPQRPGLTFGIDALLGLGQQDTDGR
ncbi:MAG TPA: 4-hydroxy-tetrahydrodipicolinate reductase [Propionibacteriaceae bacterium]|nr:4-hydroxy-tetrahydrodipicolinate reductase [Propionibacteriaceae bacterium]